MHYAQRSESPALAASTRLLQSVPPNQQASVSLAAAVRAAETLADRVMATNAAATQKYYLMATHFDSSVQTCGKLCVLCR